MVAPQTLASLMKDWARCYWFDRKWIVPEKETESQSVLSDRW